jgi:hypothetical protein
MNIFRENKGGGYFLPIIKCVINPLQLICEEKDKRDECLPILTTFNSPSFFHFSENVVVERHVDVTRVFVRQNSKIIPT